MVHVSVRWLRELERAGADIVESLVVDTEGLVGTLDEAVDRETGVVRLDDGVRSLRRWDYRVSRYYAIRIFLADVAYEEESHSGSGSSAKRVDYLEACPEIYRFDHFAAEKKVSSRMKYTVLLLIKKILPPPRA